VYGERKQKSWHFYRTDTTVDPTPPTGSSGAGVLMESRALSCYLSTSRTRYQVPGTRYQVLYLAPAPRFFVASLMRRMMFVFDTRHSAKDRFNISASHPTGITEHDYCCAHVDCSLRDDCEITR
jgi:hypothetical protein